MVLPECPQSLKHLPRLAFELGSIASQVDRGETKLTLTPSQRHYLERVRRLRVGTGFLAFDSSGRLWQATLTEVGAEIAVELQPVARELPYRLELAIAVPKGPGLDDLIRPLTELGVTDIVPVLSDRTVVVPKANKLKRWRAIAREAAEQCERVVVPTIFEPMAWRDWLKAGGVPAIQSMQRFVAAARERDRHLLTYLSARHVPGGVSVAVGPEGGWTEAELQLAVEAGVQPVGLGPRILRTVTAPLAIASWVAGYWEGTEAADAGPSEEAEGD